MFKDYMFIRPSTGFCGSALLVFPHSVQEDVKQADQVGGSGRVLGVELDTVRETKKMNVFTSELIKPCERRRRRGSPEDGLGAVHDALVGVIVGVGEEDVPAIGQRVGVDGEAVVLAGDEAAVRPIVDARLVVATVAIPERSERKGQRSKCD